ncbi:MAG: hypothetical protein OEV74_20105, partial [Cyclobacteriaceae bacterium]|nr:hypothetical protein [Cyclobacteriaceae bacterium]
PSRTVAISHPSDKIRSGYKQIRITFDVDSPAPKEVIKELLDFAKKNSPVGDSVANPVDLVVSLA